MQGRSRASRYHLAWRRRAHLARCNGRPRQASWARALRSSASVVPETRLSALCALSVSGRSSDVLRQCFLHYTRSPAGLQVKFSQTRPRRLLQQTASDQSLFYYTELDQSLFYLPVSSRPYHSAITRWAGLPATVKPLSPAGSLFISGRSFCSSHFHQYSPYHQGSSQKVVSSALR